jgi:Methylase involved in ubiquinone/menaquinone biosynthesis
MPGRRFKWGIVMNSSAHSMEKERFFNERATGWEARNYPPEKLQQVDRLVHGLPLAGIQSVLDVGCGEGVLQPFLHNYADEGTNFLALDPSPAMLQCLSLRFSDVRTLQAKAESIPLPDSSVGMIICFSAFPHIGDKPSAAKEFHRVLLPGGRAYVLHIDGREKLNQLHDSHHAVEGDHLPCPTGMRIMFSEAGFSSTEANEGPEHFYFCAKK